jgi:hypothetical protein
VASPQLSRLRSQVSRCKPQDATFTFRFIELRLEA